MTTIRLAVAALACSALITAGCANPAVPQGDNGSVSGAVTAASGQPIAGANVCVDYVDCATTAADGTYKIPSAPADPAGQFETISVTASGYIGTTQQVHIDAGKSVTVNFVLTHS